MTPAQAGFRRHLAVRLTLVAPPRPSRREPGGPPTRKLIFAHIFGWAQGAEVGMLALSFGERVAIPQSRESRVRGYLVMLAHLIPPRRARDPSPGPRRLVKAPTAVHPLPKGEGDLHNLSADQKRQPSPRGEGSLHNLSTDQKRQPSPRGEGARRRRAGEGSFHSMKP
jgi:hypothetical protein